MWLSFAIKIILKNFVYFSRSILFILLIKDEYEELIVHHVKHIFGFTLAFPPNRLWVFEWGSSLNLCIAGEYFRNSNSHIFNANISINWSIVEQQLKKWDKTCSIDLLKANRSIRLTLYSQMCTVYIMYKLFALWQKDF